MNIIKLSAVVVLSVLMAACAGTNFVRPAENAFVLGSTTRQQVEAQQGKPYQRGKITKNTEMLDSLSYAYATGGESLVGGVTPARAAGYYFLNDILVGQEFISSFKEDATDFDESKVSSIVKGKTTKEEVITLLGKPSGNYIYPLVANKDDTGIVYQYTQTKGTVFNLKFYQKLLIISINKSGIVTDVNFTSTGEQ